MEVETREPGLIGQTDDAVAGGRLNPFARGLFGRPGGAGRLKSECAEHAEEAAGREDARHRSSA